MGAAESVDVLVVGGGPAGCASALTLRRLGVHRVLVVEASASDAPRVGESIPPDTRLLLARLGVWKDFLADGHAPCLGSCSAWGSDTLGYNDFLFNVHGTGWHLDRPRFDALLSRKAQEAGAELRRGARLEHVVEAGPGELVLSMQGDHGEPSTVSACLVVDATGPRSQVARALGARQLVHDRLLCLAAFLDLEDPARVPRLSMLEAVAEGWWYAAALPGGRAVAMVATDAEIARSRGLMELEGWRSGLAATRHVGPALGATAVEGARLHARAAPSFVLDRVAGPGWIAVGDAASSYDPLSAQGIHKALHTGLQGGEAAAAWLNGDPRPLAGYEAAVSAAYLDFLRNWSYFYSTEDRWRTAPFWARRLSMRDRLAALSGALASTNSGAPRSRPTEARSP